MARILVVPDLHLPYEHPSALRFCKDLYRKHRCNQVVFLGDICDHAGISDHEKLPEADSPLEELKKFTAKVAPWYREWPDAYVCRGNHESRLTRMAAKVGIPQLYLRGLNDLWDTPNWKWGSEWIIDEVLYTHGTGYGGKYHAANMMDKLLCSVVVGHIHTVAMVYWKANSVRRIFAMNAGCLVDDKALAFAYSADRLQKAILSAATVIDGIPQLHIMPCGRNEPYARKGST